MSTNIESRLTFKALFGAVVGLSSIPGTISFTLSSSQAFGCYPFANTRPSKRLGECTGELFANPSDPDEYTFDPNRWIRSVGVDFVVCKFLSHLPPCNILNDLCYKFF